MLTLDILSGKNLETPLKFTLDNSEFVPQIEMENAISVIDTLDFSQMDAKLVSEYGWSKEEVTLMNSYYRKWLAIQVCYSEIATAPNARLDEYWHMHILDTRKYMLDCELVFGAYLHHYPYFGLEGDRDQLNDSFEVTQRLYEHHFGHRLTGIANPCSSTSCR